MVEVIGTDEFREWYDSLDQAAQAAVEREIDLLEARGVGLAGQHAKPIKGARYALRELRAHAGHRALRVLYAFDPKRRAVLLLGGEKSGSQSRFYKGLSARAERRWEQYLVDSADE